MSEPRRLWIEGPAGRLESMLRVARSPRALAVLAHPHPQYGGTLHNAVIFHADRELHRTGMTTLRFNFRGVEGSDGEHDEGRGEVRDVTAAVAWLRGLATAAPLLLVGYSFGALCAIREAIADPAVQGIVAIGLATSRYDYAETSELRRPFAVVQGDRDELAELARVREIAAATAPPGELFIVEGTGHLFPERARDVAALVVRAAASMI